MTLRAARAFPILVATALTTVACATTTAPPAPPASPAPTDTAAAAYDGMRAEILDRGEVPGLRTMSPTVELVSFPYIQGGQARRDSARGPAAVYRWLERVRILTRSAQTPFRLTASEVYRCDGAAVERGRFDVSAISALDGVRRPDMEEEYLILWQRSDDGWRVARLWLAPPVSVTPGRIADNCRSRGTSGRVLGALDRAGAAGVVLGVAVHRPALPGTDGVNAWLDTGDWDSRTADDPLGLQPRVWLGFPVGSVLRMQASYAPVTGPVVGARSELEFSSREVELQTTGHTGTLLVQVPVGPVWVGAGPSVAFMGTDRNTVTCTSVDCYSGSDRFTETVIGLAAETSYRYTGLSTFLPVLAIGYSFYPALEVAELEGAEVSLSGLTLTVGVEISP